MQLGRLAGAVALASLSATCGGKKKDGGPPPFSLALGAQAVSVSQGASADVLVSLARQAGFADDVTITLDGPPDALDADALVLPSQKKQGVLEVRVADDAPIQGLAVRITAQSGAAAASASLTVNVTAAAPSSQDLIAQDLQAGVIDYPTSLLYRAYALFGDPRLPAAYQGAGEIVEDRGLFFEAGQATLPAETQAALLPFLARPTDPQSVFNQPAGARLVGRAVGQPAAAAPSCPAGTDPGGTGWRSEKGTTYPVRVWVKCGADETVDDFDLLNARILVEGIWKPETDLMGPPILDAGGSDAGGDTDIDFYLLGDADAVVRGGDTSGFDDPKTLAMEIDAPPKTGSTSSGFLLLRRERLLNSGFKSDVVHEFFHLLQGAYNSAVTFQSVANGSLEYWYTEASAVWAETRFARPTSFTEVHKKRFARYQRSKNSLHRSVDSDSNDSLQMYASYIYPFFMEQKEGSADVIQASWQALTSASGFDQGNQLLQQVFDFTTNFRLFAVENWNADLPGLLTRDKRYVTWDPNFPDRKKPVLADQQTLSAVVTLQPTVDVAPLRAAYYDYPVSGTTLKKVIFNFEEITQKDGLDIDGLVHIAGMDWKKNDYTGQKEAKFCLDQPDQNLKEMLLVLSNHNLPLDQFDLGNLRVEASDVPCGYSWSGTASSTFGYTMNANVTFDYDDASSTPTLGVFLPRGNVSFTADPASGCVVTPGSHDIAPSEGSLTIDFSTDPPTYQAAGATVWPATYACNGSSFDGSAGGIWLGGSGPSGAMATGTVTDAGNTIQGSSSVGGFTFSWKLTRN
ncbi:MAG TPA: hypothetical protein VLD85_03280 [Anaeromyxobacteraceae bacterium]|nr:hypothetical protein [Anaeromyxobacteraceae bacterium]